MSTLLKKLLLLTLALPVLAFAQTNNKVLATVDSDPITAKDVTERMAVNLVVISQQKGELIKPTDKEKEALRLNSLEELIQERLLLNKAKKAGIVIDDSSVTETIKNLAERNETTVAKFKANVLKQNGSSAWTALQRDLKNEMTISSLVKQEVTDKITVTASEIDALLAEKKLGKGKPLPKAEGVNVIFIITKTAEKLNAAKARIEKGESFEEVGLETTELPQSEKIKSFINFSDKDLDPAVTKALKGLDDGEISQVVENRAGGFTLFKVIDHEPMVYTLEQQKIDATNIIKEQKAEAAYKTWFDALMSDAEKNNLVSINTDK